MTVEEFEDIETIETVAAVPGLRVRRYAGPDDLPGIVSIIHAANVADSFDYLPTVAQLAAEIRNPDGFDPRRDIFIADLDGRPVATGQVRYRERDDEHTYDLWGWVDPAARRRGVGRALLHLTEARARRRASAAGLATDRPIRYGTWGPDSASGLRALMVKEGYEPVRWFLEMIKADLSTPAERPLPAGLEIRPTTMTNLRQVFDAENEAFRDHWGHHEFTDGEFANLVNDPDLDLDLWRVAWDGDEVAGVVAVGVYAEENRILGVSRGWLDRISVRRQWRHRGVATALILAACRGLQERGIGEGALGVDADNPTGALALYEDLGFVRTQRMTTWRKDL
ncbi:MAG TPA: GNAT family N-acetyltransferase, partial [Candidatus Binatia bacterium]|nr:GNAT family N-acetyltransferase [Candidatus Binatia bacterium]